MIKAPVNSQEENALNKTQFGFHLAESLSQEYLILTDTQKTSPHSGAAVTTRHTAGFYLNALGISFAVDFRAVV